jgi:hypothetical protein
MNSSFYNGIENTNLSPNMNINKVNKVNGNINPISIKSNGDNCLVSTKKHIMKRNKMENNKSMHNMNNKKSI